METFITLIIGICAGALSGVLGIGGGIIVTPALMYFMKFPQKMAQGTSLLMLLPPIGIFAVMEYKKAGNLNIRTACILIIGFVISSFISAKYAQNINEIWLKRFFGILLLYVAGKLLFAK